MECTTGFESLVTPVRSLEHGWSKAARFLCSNCGRARCSAGAVASGIGTQTRATELTVGKPNVVHDRFQEFSYSRAVPTARAVQNSTVVVLELWQDALSSRRHYAGGSKTQLSAKSR